MIGPKKVKRCSECKRVFANPESFRMHKLKGIGCRTVEGLIARGYVETDGKWNNRIK